MALPLLKNTRAFHLQIRCTNCLRDTECVLEVPVWPESPQYADELVGDACLQSLRYKCRSCGSVIGQIVSIEGGDLT